MHHAGNGAQVNKPMQLLPALAGQASHHSFSRGKRQRDEQDEAGETGSDERALDYVFRDALKVKELIQPDIGREMQASIKECVETYHPAQSDQPLQACDLA